MSVAQRGVYRPVLEVLMDKLKERAASGKNGVRARVCFALNEESSDAWAICWAAGGPGQLGVIVNFMSGMKRANAPERRNDRDREVHRLVYQALTRPEDREFRPTDPSKAPPAPSAASSARPSWSMPRMLRTRRRNAEREMKIVQIEENNFKP